jgi:hypothetical protein
MLNEAFRYVESIVAYFISPPLYRVVNSLYTLLESIQACAVTATSIFNLDTTRMVSFTPRQAYPRGKSFRYPLNMRLGGPQSGCGRPVRNFTP